VLKLKLDRDSYAQRFFASGQQITLFNKAKRERFAEHFHPQGLVERVTEYQDFERTIPLQILERFVNRHDKLCVRTRKPKEGMCHEQFLPGRLTGLKDHIDIFGRRREFRFYVSARLDGLARRNEILGVKIVEEFEGRDDFLTYRSVTIDQDMLNGEVDSLPVYTFPCGQLGDLPIKKMCQKYERNPDVPADDDIRKRTFFVSEGQIRCIFHYAEGRVTASRRLYYKDRSLPTEITQIDPFAVRPKPQLLEQQLQQTLVAEKDCYGDVRNSERETQDILGHRKIEEANVKIDQTVFEIARRKTKEDKKEKEQGKQEEEEHDERHVDYLTPFLQNVDNIKEILPEEAQSARTACLSALKERLLERANIIQRRLDEENTTLAKKQAAFQRSREHLEGADEAFEAFCSKAMFRIQILEQRLARHEETALQKYADMDMKLRNDPRLGVLKN
jgi:hypothetical protein